MLFKMDCLSLLGIPVDLGDLIFVSLTSNNFEKEHFLACFYTKWIFIYIIYSSFD